MCVVVIKVGAALIHDNKIFACRCHVWPVSECNPFMTTKIINFVEVVFVQCELVSTYE